MKQGRTRTMSICLTDLPKDRILKHNNGKLYLNLQTYDFNEPDKFNNDFSVSLPLNEKEKALKKTGEKVNRIFLGNGKIWEDQEMKPISESEADDLPF